jgi:CRISPR/Cas system-associated endoribonuclease Cas2
MHEKWDLTQDARIVIDPDTNRECLKFFTHVCAYFGVEWLQSSWFKSLIRSRSMQAIKADHVRLCQTFDEQIRLDKQKKRKLRKREQETEDDEYEEVEEEGEQQR